MRFSRVRLRIDFTTGEAIGALTQFIATTVRFTTAHSVIFDTPVAQRYEKALGLLGLQFWMLSPEAGHA